MLTTLLIAAVLPFTPQTERLPNGLTLVMVPFPSPGLIAYNTVFRVGSRDETEKGVTGFAHFFEHISFRGTEAYPPDKVQAFLKQTGADQNGYTTDDFTNYTFFGRSNQLEELVRMEADRFQNLNYSEDVFKAEAGAVLGEYNKSASNPHLLLNEKLREKTFATHTYGHTTLGYLKDIEDMPNQYAYSKTFFQRFYTPDNAFVIAVGDFDPAQLSALVKQYYASWSKKRATTATREAPPQKKEIREHLGWKNPTLPILSLSWRTPARNQPSQEGAVQDILFELLFGKLSAVHTELVLDKQLVQESFDEESWPHRDAYLFHVIARLKAPDAAKTVEERVERAIADLAAGKIEPQFLEDVKSNVRYSTVLAPSTPDRVAALLAGAIGATGQVDALERRLLLVSKVSKKDVQAFAKKYLTKANRTVITLSTEETKK
jgi:zinc protease